MFTEAEVAYLRSQRLGRLATLGPGGAPQARPVGFFYNADDGTIDIGGRDLGNTQKFRNIARDGRFSFVVDDLASIEPWRPRGVEIRGRAEALTDVDPPMGGMTRQIIRLHPERVLSWALEPEVDGLYAHA
jgi:pyridoxamine 5'-phosphate oxidase family protein